jgi:hypothetical protein
VKRKLSSGALAAVLTRWEQAVWPTAEPAT